MSKLEQVKKILEKASSLEKGKEIGLAKEFISLDDNLKEISSKIEEVSSVVDKVDNKEVRTYENELSSLIEKISELNQIVIDKSTIVNVPLDELSKDIIRVEKAIKNIKEPLKYPTDISVNNLDNGDIVDAIKAIPEFPIVEINNIVSGLEKKLLDLRVEIPDFDYSRLEKKLEEIVKAVKNVSITVQGGGGGPSNVGLFNKDRNTINPATEEKQTAMPSAFNDEALWLLRRMVKLMESNAVIDLNSRQRVTVDVIAAGALANAGVGVALSGNLVTATAPILGTQYPLYVWEAPVEQRWRVIDDARKSYELGIRNHLSFT